MRKLKPFEDRFGNILYPGTIVVVTSGTNLIQGIVSHYTSNNMIVRDIWFYSIEPGRVSITGTVIVSQSSAYFRVMQTNDPKIVHFLQPFVEKLLNREI